MTRARQHQERTGGRGPIAGAGRGTSPRLRGWTWTALAVMALAASLTAAAAAHHGVASLGAAGLEGPGAAVETSSSSMLPAGSILVYTKLDYASFELKTAARDDEGDYNAFWMHGVGVGITSYLSAYAFVPFYTKKTEDNSFNTSGFADVSVAAALGFTFDGGLRLTPAHESLDDLEDWHLSLVAGATLPTGQENLRNADGEIDPGMSLGFGAPSFMGGLAATKQFGPRLTLAAEASFITFSEHTYADDAKVRFGDELRLNLAVPLRVFTDGDRKVRLDLDLEGNYLQLGRDEADGIGEDATGGAMVYMLPGIRGYIKNFSVGAGVKIPVWTDLNEEDDQQGAEGKEDYRLILTLSTLL